MTWTRLDPALRGFCLVILGILVAASLITGLMALLMPDKDFRELRSRVRTWWVMAGLVVGVLLLPRAWAVGFFGFLSFLALKEFFTIIPTRRADRRVLLLAYLAIPLQYTWIGTDWYGMFAIFIPVYMFLLLPIRMVLIGETEGFLHAAGTVHWGLMSMVYSLSHISAFLTLPAQTPGKGGGVAWVLLAVFLTQFNDVAQYIWGRLFGKHPVIPKVSPKKTVEGLLGGLATTLALAVFLGPWLVPMSRLQGAVIGLIAGLGGFLGDVTISAVKRDLGIKDSGTLLPGHGGILDRVDSLLVTAPLLFHVVRYLKLH
jgi:phosphatidate cytidylyltransferase